jgi:hypothetical protein
MARRKVSDCHEKTTDSQSNSEALNAEGYPYRVKEGAWLAGVCKGWEDMGRGKAWKYRLLFLVLTVYGAPVYAYFALARPLKSNLFTQSRGMSHFVQSIKSRRRKAALFTAAAAISPFVAVSILVAYEAPSIDSGGRIGGMRAPKVGDTQYIGRGSCDQAVKVLLRDPSSFERITTQIIDVKAGEGWVAQVDFRARNGFGGYDTGSAFCVFDGSSYRALLNE